MPERENWSEDQPKRGIEPVPKGKDGAAAARIRQQHLWVDLQVQEAMARGEFDDLPGAGKPIKDLGEHHDPDWWLKKLVEREKISVLPSALALRKEDLELDAQLDKENIEGRVVKALEDFNRRIINARRQLEGGPPVITPLRDIDAEVAAWRERRAARRAAGEAAGRAGNQARKDVSEKRSLRRLWRRR
ncbi:hypothetical protein BJ980_002082 [Nocardioides daedukensis]|uniref:DnaJ homologue subfamily C member 28 conserved domain-containing protein n=1 Tax=Nocardioides daedukensis TaxID=634462 RepID=A0A7Y9UTU2_9ACTN|nr:DUF1992 domain-containing protein [Nocardioides daedukensis]NYG59159.1 hypothetical protein [Nocardioides daedukensis]